ncbi:MAG: hypothetical protein ACK5HL_04280 [Bacilli bacterium]
MKINKWMVNSVFILFLVYIVIYISQVTGYYEYSESKKTSLTKEQIIQFEQDVKDGKKVDIKDYSSVNTYHYDNNVSNSALSMSNGIEKTTKNILNSFFDITDKIFGL